jgi:transposase
MDLSSPETAGVVSAEVNVAPRSKRYTPAFKARIMEEADRCHAPGELGALLRREGIFFSTLADFRKQKAREERNSKRNPTSPKEEVAPHLVKELAASEREIRRLRRELDCATALLELQKKVSDLLGLALAPRE